MNDIFLTDMASTMPINYESESFIPLFPDYSRMKCEDLKSEILDLEKNLKEVLSDDVRYAYAKALDQAQSFYQKCGLNDSDDIQEVFVGDSKSPIKTEIPSAQGNPTFFDDKTNKTKIAKEEWQPYLIAGLLFTGFLLILNGKS